MPGHARLFRAQNLEAQHLRIRNSKFEAYAVDTCSLTALDGNAATLGDGVTKEISGSTALRVTATKEQAPLGAVLQPFAKDHPGWETHRWRLSQGAQPLSQCWHGQLKWWDPSPDRDDTEDLLVVCMGAYDVPG